MDTAPPAFSGDRETWLLYTILRQARANHDDHTSCQNKAQYLWTGDTFVPHISVQKADTEIGMASIKDAIAKVLGDCSPKLQFLAQSICDTVKRDEKATTWTMWPFEQILTHSFLCLFGVRSRAYLATLSHSERVELINGFNMKEPPRNPDDLRRSQYCNVLACSFQFGREGLNLHKSCWIAIILIAIILIAISSDAIMEQLIGRIFRFGQKHHVHAYEVCLQNSFDTTMADQVAKRALPSLMASLDRQELALTSGVKDGDDYAFDRAENLLGFRGRVNDKTNLFEYKHESVWPVNLSSSPENPKYFVPEDWMMLTPEQLLRCLHRSNKGRAIKFRSDGDEDTDEEEHVENWMHRLKKQSKKSTKRKADDGKDGGAANQKGAKRAKKDAGEASTKGPQGKTAKETAGTVDASEDWKIDSGHISYKDRLGKWINIESSKTKLVQLCDLCVFHSLDDTPATGTKAVLIHHLRKNVFSASIGDDDAEEGDAKGMERKGSKGKGKKEAKAKKATTSKKYPKPKKVTKSTELVESEDSGSEYENDDDPMHKHFVLRKKDDDIAIRGFSANVWRNCRKTDLDILRRLCNFHGLQYDAKARKADLIEHLLATGPEDKTLVV